MERIAVVGSGGVGKSTFADELGHRTGVRVVHLDELFWKPGWVETPRQEWEQVQREIVSERAWIVDGNYGGTLDVRLSRADTLIVLSLPRWRCLLRALRRSVRNRGKHTQAAGCPERIDFTFYRWIWRYPNDSRPRLDAAIQRHAEHLEVIELRSTTEVAAFLASTS